MRLLAWVFAVAVCVPVTLEARQWTDTTGDYRREAEYVDQSGGMVWLRAIDGKVYRVALEQLSRADQQYVASVASRTEPAAATSVFRTLQLRTAPSQGAPSRSAPTEQRRTPQRLAAEASVARLTGWHCYGGHCHVKPCGPVHPCPSPPDKGKRIYAGHHSTFHLVCRHKNEICGTGAYKFVDKNGCCHEYLVLLRFQVEIPNFWLLYRVDGAAPLGIQYWLFENTAISKYCYKVYYWSGTQYVLYDCACRRIPE